MDAKMIGRLDKMERDLIDKLDKQLRDRYYSDAEKTSQILVNIATYRRLVAGDKIRLRADAAADLAAAR